MSQKPRDAADTMLPEQEAYNDGVRAAGQIRSQEKTKPLPPEQKKAVIMDAFNRFKSQLPEQPKPQSNEEKELAKKWLEGWKDSYFDDPV